MDDLLKELDLSGRVPSKDDKLATNQVTHAASFST